MKKKICAAEKQGFVNNTPKVGVVVNKHSSANSPHLQPPAGEGSVETYTLTLANKRKHFKLPSGTGSLLRHKREAAHLSVFTSGYSCFLEQEV